MITSFGLRAKTDWIQKPLTVRPRAVLAPLDILGSQIDLDPRPQLRK